jgi:RHS repeat-associated protein
MPFTAYETIDGQILSQTSGATTARLVTDALGSVRGRNTGTTFDGLSSYTPYGVGTAPSGTRLGWNGTWGYIRTGQTPPDHYVDHRHYASSSGRWTTVDPLWPAEESYSYTTCNPTSLYDPSGLQRYGRDKGPQYHPTCVDKSCPSDVRDAVLYWNARFVEMLPVQRQAINDCIQKTVAVARSAGKHLTCDSITWNKIICVNDFFLSGILKCVPSGSITGSGATELDWVGDMWSGRFDQPQHRAEYIALDWPSSPDVFADLIDADINREYGLAGLIIHEALHACGYDHYVGQAVSDPAIFCNNIAACCVIDVIENRGRPLHFSAVDSVDKKGIPVKLKSRQGRGINVPYCAWAMAKYLEVLPSWMQLAKAPFGAGKRK